MDGFRQHPITEAFCAPITNQPRVSEMVKGMVKKTLLRLSGPIKLRFDEQLK